MEIAGIILKRCGLLVLCACLLAGCGDYHAHLDEMLLNYRCARNVVPKVGADREVILFVKHHIMVSDTISGRGAWDPHGFTRTPKEIIPWESVRFCRYRKEIIPRLMDGVNSILYSKNTHVLLVNDGVEVNADPLFFPADFDLQGNARGNTLKAMRKMVSDDPEHLHILYGWTSLSKALGSGENFAVAVADDPRYGARISSRELAREIMNALAVTSKTGLSRHSGAGDSLGGNMVHDIWIGINTRGKKMKSISCSPDSTERDDDLRMSD